MGQRRIIACGLVAFAIAGCPSSGANDPSDVAVEPTPSPGTVTFAPIEAVFDIRPFVLSPRSRKELIVSISNAEREHASAPPDDPRQHGILWQLAVGYAELDASARNHAEANRAHPEQNEKRRKEVRKAEAIARAARKTLAKHLSRLHSHYRMQCRDKNAPPNLKGCADEALYYLGVTHMLDAAYEDARKTFLELTENWKKSHFVPHAYMAFGELFFEESRHDASKVQIAINFFREVVKYPDSRMFGLAHYRLAELEHGRGELEKARKHAEGARSFAEDKETVHGAKELEAAAGAVADQL